MNLVFSRFFIRELLIVRFIAKIAAFILALFGVSDTPQGGHNCSGCTMCMPPPRVTTIDLKEEDEEPAEE